LIEVKRKDCNGDKEEILLRPPPILPLAKGEVTERSEVGGGLEYSVAVLKKRMTGFDMNKRAMKNSILAAVMMIAFLAPAQTGNKNAVSSTRDGWKYLEKGDHFRAILNFKNALNKNPRYLDALTGLGYCYYKTEAYDDAAKLFADALKLNGRSGRALTGMGLSLLGLGKKKQALDYFNRALDVSGEDLEAHYGIAYLYRLMGREIWAERKIESIFRINPYHVDSLLLMADIKSSASRFDEARKYALRAIDSGSDNPEGYIAYASILMREFMSKGRGGAVSEAIDSLNKALSIRPDSYRANKLMGTILLMQERYPEAAAHYQKAYSLHPGPSVLYNLAVARDRAGSPNEALEAFLQAYKKSPSDPVLRARTEDFLVFRDFEIGHPARVLFGGEEFQAAVVRERANLPDEAVMYLRRALLVNPMNRDARERLMRYYDVLGYKVFYVNELKDMNRLFPQTRYEERLAVEIIKRRNDLYHREGYSSEEPPRDVPALLVFDFDADPVSVHADIGPVLADSLTFTLGQIGRQRPVGIRARRSAVAGYSATRDFEQALEDLTRKISDGDCQQVDYVLYGSCREDGKSISVECNLMDFRRGVIINTVSISESGRDALASLCLRLSRRIYDFIPYTGRVLNLKEQGVIVNLGLFDGVTAGSMLVLRKIPEKGEWKDVSKSVYFTVKEADTLISYAEPVDRRELELVDSSDVVYPHKRRRARMIE